MNEVKVDLWTNASCFLFDTLIRWRADPLKEIVHCLFKHAPTSSHTSIHDCTRAWLTKTIFNSLLIMILPMNGIPLSNCVIQLVSLYLASYWVCALESNKELNYHSNKIPCRATWLTQTQLGHFEWSIVIE